MYTEVFEDSFLEMKALAKEVMTEYESEDFYPKRSYSRQVIMQLKKCKKDTIIEEENTQDNM